MRPTGILVFIPTHSQSMMAETGKSLYNLAGYLTRQNIHHALTWVSAADIEDIRNLAVTSWYDGHPEFSHLLFIDADMGFPCDPDPGKPNLIRDMIKFDKPVMGCFYAKRSATPGVVGTADAHTLADVKHGFLKASGIGCGVMMIERSVIKTMLEKLPHLSSRITSLLAKAAPDLNLQRIIGAFDKISTDERMLSEARANTDLLAALAKGEPLEDATAAWMQAIKDNRLNDGRRLKLSEDMSFCYRWVEQCGGEIWANVNHRISHVGPFDYAIRYGAVLEANEAAKDKAA